MNKYTCLPKELLNVGQSLEPIGILEMAWKNQEALKVIDFLINKGYAILGGDVYKYDENGIKSTYDSWFINKTIRDSLIEESRIKSYEYIKEYSKNNGDGYLYSIIFESE